jgi:COP9 signalosome complex subunit 1
MGNEDLGKHYQAIGEPSKAFEAFGRMRQDVSVPKHIVDVSQHLIEVGIEQRNWIAVASNSQKIKGVQGSFADEKSTQQYVAAADGLSSMDIGDYYAAAGYFLSAEPGMGSNCNTIISPNDIAVYGGLCALASMDRRDLQRRVLENSNFRTYLELEPQIRRAIVFFVSSRYTACLDILEAYRADYLLDIHLYRHVDELYYMVRSKSIVQYFIPFSCVTLDSLNSAFAAPGKSIDKELSQMIQRKELDARIDTQNRVGCYALLPFLTLTQTQILTSAPSAARPAMQAQALATAKNYEREARRRIQHMNIAAADLDIRAGKKQGPLDGLLEKGLLGQSHRELRPR